MPKEFRDGDRGVQIIPPSHKRQGGSQNPPEPDATINVTINQGQAVSSVLVGFAVVALMFVGVILFIRSIILPTVANVLLVLSIFFHGRKVLLWLDPPGLSPLPSQPKLMFYILLVVVLASYAVDPQYQGFPFNWIGMVAVTILAFKAVFIVKAPKLVPQRVLDYSVAVVGVVYPALLYLAWFGVINMSQ